VLGAGENGEKMWPKGAERLSEIGAQVCQKLGRKERAQNHSLAAGGEGAAKGKQKAKKVNTNRAADCDWLRRALAPPGGRSRNCAHQQHTYSSASSSPPVAADF